MLIYTPSLFLEAFSITHVGVIQGALKTESFSGDIYGVRSASIKAQISENLEFSNDVAVGVSANVEYLEIAVSSGYISWDILNATNVFQTDIVGLYPESAAFQAPLYPNQSPRSPYVSMIFKAPAKDSAGNVREVKFILYRCQLLPIEFSSLSYKEGLVTTYRAKSFLSTSDENNQLIDRPAFGHVLTEGLNPSDPPPNVSASAYPSLFWPGITYPSQLGEESDSVSASASDYA
jgi:hypothetical protein